MTALELLQQSIPDKRVELVDGIMLVREPAGFDHGRVAASILVAIANYVSPRRLGIVVAAETGFKLFSDPDTVRAADVAFVAQSRVPYRPEQGYLELAPDLVVEIRSPGDRANAVREKVADWLEAGSRLVWLVDPRARRAAVFRPDNSENVVFENGTLDGENVVPGFSVPLSLVL